MNRKTRFLLLLMMVCLCASVQADSANSGNDNKYNHVVFQSLPALTASPGQGISAPFAGTLDDGALLVAGGCNFPDTPAADGGDGKSIGGRKDCRTTNFPLLSVARGVKFCSPSHGLFL